MVHGRDPWPHFNEKTPQREKSENGAGGRRGPEGSGCRGSGGPGGPGEGGQKRPKSNDFGRSDNVLGTSLFEVFFLLFLLSVSYSVSLCWENPQPAPTHRERQSLFFTFFLFSVGKLVRSVWPQSGQGRSWPKEVIAALKDPLGKPRRRSSDDDGSGETATPPTPGCEVHSAALNRVRRWEQQRCSRCPFRGGVALEEILAQASVVPVLRQRLDSTRKFVGRCQTRLQAVQDIVKVAISARDQR